MVYGEWRGRKEQWKRRRRDGDGKEEAREKEIGDK
jgi:hypothetical protein